MSLGFGKNATFQFFRTERWLGRVHAIYEGEYKTIGTFDDLLDHVLAFFLNCHHIKDWLKHGPGWHDDVLNDIKKAAIEQFVSETEALRICADLCNGNKHFHFDRDLRSGVAPSFGFTKVKIDATVTPPVNRAAFTLRTARGDTDALALARECIEAWRSFIRESTVDSLEQLADRRAGQRGKGKPSSGK